MLIRMDTHFDIADFGGNGLLYFSADWCGPCKVLSPALEKMSEEEEYSDFNIFQIPAETNREMFELYDVDSHPVIVIMKNSKKVTQINGVIDMENQAEKDVLRLKKLLKSLYKIG